MPKKSKKPKKPYRWHRGVKKHWRVEIKIKDAGLLKLEDGSVMADLYANVYIHADTVIKTAHDTVFADGIAIGLPGNVKKITEQIP